MSDNNLLVKFYGTRGSIPVSDAGYQMFGGNTTCIAIYDNVEKSLSIIDAGTGIRNLGKDILQGKFELGHRHVSLGFTHFHWDHIQGFPFFGPAYQDDFAIDIMSFGRNKNVKNLKSLFDAQMQEAFFPIALSDMGAQMNFITIEQQSLKVNGFELSVTPHPHPGTAYSIKIEKYGKCIVICTDVEHGEQLNSQLIQFANGADLLIHDAQYTQSELKKRKGWGHSSYEQAIEMAEIIGCDRLVFTHHDPDHDDKYLMEREQYYQKQFNKCVMAREGMVLGC